VHAAQGLDFGADCTHQPEDLANAAAFVVWGKNLAVTRVHWMPFVKLARKRGAPLVVIDPLRSATAKLADRHLAIRPGSDAMLALGVGRLLIERGAVDEAFVASHTVGFEQHRALVMSRSLAEVAAATDLRAADIEALAQLYATAKPLCTMVGLGLGYWEHGAASVRLVDALAAVTGNVGVSGGGVNTDFVTSPGFDLSAVERAPRAETRTLLLPRLGDEILASSAPPVKMGWIAGANPAATAPDTEAVKRGLDSLEFLVVVEQFMTATAERAHLLLPCTTYLEADDLVTAYGHAWVSLTRRVVPPLGEAMPDAEILQRLAERLGFGAALAGDPESWMRRLLAPLEAEGLTLERLREGPVRHPRAAAVPFASRAFSTPSGKVELVGALPVASPRPCGAGQLRLMATKTLPMVNSQILPRDLPEEPVVRLHPEALAARGLRAGAYAVLATAAGEQRVRVEVDAAQRRDVAVLNPALWRGNGSGVNRLREARVTDLGDGAAMHETLATLRPA
jgi:anaerobic selenocysteine-containing dehydrogenase